MSDEKRGRRRISLCALQALDILAECGYSSLKNSTTISLGGKEIPPGATLMATHRNARSFDNICLRQEYILVPLCFKKLTFVIDIPLHHESLSPLGRRLILEWA